MGGGGACGGGGRVRGGGGGGGGGGMMAWQSCTLEASMNHGIHLSLSFSVRRLVSAVSIGPLIGLLPDLSNTTIYVLCQYSTAGHTASSILIILIMLTRFIGNFWGFYSLQTANTTG